MERLIGGRITPEKPEYCELSQTMQAIWSLGYRRLIVEGDDNSIINKKTSNLRLRHSTRTICNWECNRCANLT